jgi:putative protein kinase ArgK-like GTPase of G3E family
MASFERWLSTDGRLKERREQQWQERLTDMVRAELLRDLRTHGLEPQELADYARRIAARQQDPFVLAAELVQRITGRAAKEAIAR